MIPVAPRREGAGSLRIASGTLRGRKIRTPPGGATRPLLTRIRKSLVDILRPRLPMARVLDLFGGSGAVTFELLSNGATEAVLVEIDTETSRLIRESAHQLGISACVINADALHAIPRLSAAGERFDVILIAPPYGQSLQQLTLDALAEHGLLASRGMVVIQRDSKEPLCQLGTDPTFRHVGSRRYGRTAFDFYVGTEEPGG